MSIAEKLQTIAENEQRVYDRGYGIGNRRGHSEGFGQGRDFGYQEGYGKGYDDGVAAGGGDDAFWDVYQDNGNRKSYAYAFSGDGWKNDNFYPKYNIIPEGTALRMFARGLSDVDVEKRLLDLGIVLDTSKVTASDGFSYFCEYSSPSVLPIIDTTGTSSLNTMFQYAAYLVTIRKLILKDDGSQTLVNAFRGSEKIENIEIVGVIGDSVDFRWAKKLSAGSIRSIMWALSETSTGKTITLSKTAVDVAFANDDFVGSDTLDWGQLVLDRPNWTVNLV